MSVHLPDFNNRVLDRFIVAAESSRVNLTIVLNKIDLDESKISERWKNFYENIGYKFLLTSCETNSGINNLHKELSGRKNLFCGHSGVGKSSLLNKMYPQLILKTGAVSKLTSKGTHTTVTSLMMQVENDTFIIDTPGIREIDPYGIKKIDLGHYFIEFSDYLNNCKFNTCTHHHEPGCAVVNAVETGSIKSERYESYLRILDTIEDDLDF
jgi:ribosome biogenesis GTPase